MCWPTGCVGWPAVVLAHQLWGLAGCRAFPPAVGVGLLSPWPAVCVGWLAVVLAHRLWGLAGCRAFPPAVGVGRLSP